VSEDKFVKGLYANKPNERAPKFIVCELSIKVNELIGYLNDQDGEWVNIQIKTPMNVAPDKPRRLTVSINDWKPAVGNERKPAKKDDFDDDLPF